MPLKAVRSDAGATIFDEMRESHESVARAARFVKIREDVLEGYADKLPSAAPENTYDMDHHFIGTAEETAAYVMCVESVNFGSGYAPRLKEENWPLVDNSQYFTVATRLKHHFEKNGAPPAHELARLMPQECAALFRFDTEKPYSRELSGLFCTALQQLGRHMQDEYGGSFLSFVEAAGGSADEFIRRIAHIPFFRDVQEYKGMDVPFYKRAQLAVATLQIEFERVGRHAFDDTSGLTMFADNGVPHVLRVDGILDYAPSLAERIEAGEEIPAGAEEEIEIRACACHAVELMARYKGMRASDIDFILWHRSVESASYSQCDTHRTRTIFY